MTAKYTAQYRRNRAIVLAGNPLCVYCNIRPANTVDHIIELDRGGGDGLDNLVPACKPCNYGKGARYGNTKRSRISAMRRQAVVEATAARKLAPFYDTDPVWMQEVKDGKRYGWIDHRNLWWSECQWCGVTFNPYTGCVSGHKSTGQYCSRQCAGYARRKALTRTEGSVIYEFTCRSCGQRVTRTGRPPGERGNCGSDECRAHINGRVSIEAYWAKTGKVGESKYPPLKHDLQLTTVGERVTFVVDRNTEVQFQELAGEVRPTQKGEVPALSGDSLVHVTCPDSPSSLSLHKDAPKKPGTPRDRTGSAQVGTDSSEFPAPRFATRWSGDVSWGLEACGAYARFKNIELMPWQRYAVCAQLAQVDGRLVHRTALTTLPRQQGKTVAMGALILWWTTIHAERTGRPENVILVGHMLKTLEQVIMRDLGNRMVEQFDAKFFRSSGRMEIELPNGSRIWALAANDSAGHGLSASLVVADELWDIDADVVDQAIMPTQSAQQMPLFSAWSTAGTEASTLMLRYRQLGLDAIDKGQPTRNLFLEWSAPPSADLHDPAVWAACNPAWGHTVNPEEVESESRLEWQSFLRKRLNMWVSAQNSWLEPGTWEELVTEEQPVGSMKVLAVDSSPDGSRIVGVAVWPLEGDRVLVAPAFTVTSEREAWAQIRALLEPTTMLAITPGLNGHTPPELAARTTQVGYGELSQWTSPVINRIIHGTVAHHGEQLLTDHISRAVAVTTKDGLVLSSQKSPGPIELARCAVWAIYLATKPTRTARPAIGKATSRPRNWVL